ncbi:hypothetical protein [Chryseobacterium candidae]|uniref:Uncharacterized protein n=1 Tax=Chryseobacterium candidae TaxID=1978493 RepID=A0ABY2R4I5_9FLAO|nr:hypothetical protein [Chryseobacterium candidae]THV57070.1 hypothetical protein EK417_16530 [Chryseobacterium candidae]
MENKIIQIDGRIKNYIKYCFLAIFFVIFFLVFFRKKTTENSLIDYEIHAKVVDIYRDRNEHNFLFVKYSNGSVELLDYPYKIGDSISKKKGDSIEYILRNGTWLKNNLIQQDKKTNIK